MDETALEFSEAAVQELECVSSFRQLLSVINLGPPSDWQMLARILSNDRVALADIELSASAQALHSVAYGLLHGTFLPALAAPGVRFTSQSGHELRIRRYESDGSTKWLVGGERAVEDFIRCRLEQIRFDLFRRWDSELASWVLRHTWMGSLAPQHYGRVIQICVEDHEEIVRSIPSQREAALSGVVCVPLEELGYLFLRCRSMCESELVGGDTDAKGASAAVPVRIRTHDFGEIPVPEEVSPRLRTRLRRLCDHFGVTEMQLPASFRPRLDLLGMPLPSAELGRYLLCVVRTLSDHLDQFDGSPLGQARARLVEQQEQLAARRISARVQDCKSRPMLEIAGRPLGLKPSNETEVVLLFGKLEALGEIPFDINVVEYTGKRDIDAIGTFRFNAALVPETLAPIEFEFVAESFFAHDHPVGHARLVICWGFKDQDAPSMGLGGGVWRHGLHGVKGLWQFSRPGAHSIALYCLGSLFEQG
jgi:hypothetical protein